MSLLPRQAQGRWTLRQAVHLVLLAASGLAVFLFVDLSPEVERDLFFSSDDPQLAEHERIREMFPAPAQIIVAVHSDDGFPEAYVALIREFSRDLRGIEGVHSTLDLLHGPDDLEEAFENPFWQRLLVAEDGQSTNVIVLLETEEYDEVVPAIGGVVEAHDSSAFPIAVSGEPYVVERMRELIVRDFLVFGLGALLLFTLAVSLLYRSARITLGTVAAGGTAVALTILARPLFGLQVDLLTPNIVTVVFVLTLLHVVFITNNWRLAAGEDDPVRAALRWTRPASFWAMLTTGLGFGMLLLAPAAPARNFGVSGAVGTGIAFLCAYLIFPDFLRSAEPARTSPSSAGGFVARTLEHLHPRATLGIGALALVAAPGLLWLNTDPELFEYFQSGSDIREGLERIDRAGGSSSLELVVRDEEGRELANDDAFDRMWALQMTLEEDPDVGSVLSLPVIMAEAEEQTFWSFLLSWDFLVDRMDSPEHERIAASFITEDRKSGRFMLRMKESARGEQSRREVIGRVEAAARDHGFQPAMVGGLYRLQAEISDLVRSSLVTGLLGLTLLFIVIAFIVAPSAGVAAAMILSFSAIPLSLLAVFGYFGVPFDVIALPAANIALALGVDDLIHLVHQKKRLDEGKASRDAGEEREAAGAWNEEGRTWIEARAALLQPIVSSSVIVVLGFGLFLLSSFPPTQRLGGAVVVGAVVAAVMVLLAFPTLATLFRTGGLRRSAGSATREP